MYKVYIIRSLVYKNQHYVGYTSDLKSRLLDHNGGNSNYTKKYRPWGLVCYIAFKNKDRAKEFERYLKSGSGRAFLKRHLF